MFSSSYHLLISKVTVIIEISKFVKKPIFLILLWSLWLSIEYWGMGDYSYIRIHDNAETNLSYRVLTSQIFKEHGFTSWIQNIAGGIDSQIINNISYFTYDFLPFLLFPGWFAYALIMFLQRFLAAYFTYRLCSDFLNLKTTTALVAGLVWSLGTWSTNGWTLFDRLGPPLIPLYLYLLEVSLSKTGYRKYIWASVSGLLLSYNSFFPLFTPFFIAGSFLWLWIVRSHKIKLLLIIYLCFGLSTLVFDIPQITAIYFNAPLSGRAERTMLSIAYSEAIRSAFLGTINFFFTYKVLWTVTLVAFVISKFRDKLIGKMIAFAGGVVIVSKALWVISVTNRETMSFLSLINFNDFVLITCFVPSISAAYLIECVGYSGKDSYLSNKLNNLEINIRKITLIGLIAICLWQSFYIKLIISKRFPSDNYSVIYKNPDLKKFAKTTDNELFRVATVGPSNSSAYSASGKNFYPNYAQVYGFETADGYLGMYSERYEDFWGEVIRPLRIIDPIADNRWKTKPVWIYLYAPFDGSFNNIDLIQFDKYYNLNLLSLSNTKYIISRWPLEDEKLMLKSEPISAQEDRLQWDQLSRLGKCIAIFKDELPHRALYIYENRAVLPRAYITHKAMVFDKKDELMSSMRKASVEDLRTTVFFEKSELTGSNLKPVPSGVNASKAEITEYLPDQLTVSAKAETPGYLVLTNNFSPFWKCWIDGVKTKIIPAYHTFQTIYVEEGEHQVLFKYDPPYNVF